MALRPDLFSKVCDYIERSEETVLHKYLDSMGIPTILDGLNLNDSNAKELLAKVGLDYDNVIAAPTCHRNPPHGPQCGLPDLATKQQARQVLELFVAPVVQEAAISIKDFDTISDARKFVVIDLCYNMGDDEWLDFAATRSLISADDFEDAAKHLEASAWYSQVGDRAKRDVAMMRSGQWLAASYPD